MTDVLTSRKVTTPWLPFQQAWMNDDAPLKAVEKSRRIGLTYVEAYDVTSQRFRRSDARNVDYWFSSADDSAAGEFIEYCRFFARDVFGAIADYFTEQVADEATTRLGTSYNIRCPNGKRITAMSSNPRRFRSKGGDVGLDEFGFHDQAREMYRAAQPSTMRGGRLRVISTHNGEDSQFNYLVKQARKVLVAMGHSPDRPPIRIDYALLKTTARKIGAMPIKLHRITLLDAVADGLVENINRYQGTTLTREEFVDDCRASCIDEDMWNQEYMCIPSVELTALLTYALIESCESEDLNGAVGDVDASRIGSGRLFGGMDIGRINDPSVMWLVEQVGDLLITRGVKWLERVTFAEQEAVLDEWMNLPGMNRFCIDASGMGMQFAEDAQRRWGSYRVESVKFTAPLKEQLAPALKRGFEDRAFRIPADRRIRESLHKVRQVRTAAGNVRFDAARDEKGHADEFWALALAQHAAGGSTGPIGYQGSESKLVYAGKGTW